MGRRLFLFGIILLLTFCNKHKEIVEYYPNGEIKLKYYLQDTLKVGEYREFYENGYPRTIYLYEQGIIQDSSIHFYEKEKGVIKTIKYWKDGNAYYQKDFFENGNLMRKGPLLEDQFRIGKWDLYAPENYKSEIIEYFRIENQSYVNQVWKLNSKGDTIGGNHYKLLRKRDTVNISEPNRFHFYLVQSALENGSAYVLVPKNSKQLKADFSDVSTIDWDTIKNMSITFRNHPVYRDWKKDVLFEVVPTNKGLDTLRGALLEKEIVTDTDTVDFITRHIYFAIPFYVRE